MFTERTCQLDQSSFDRLSQLIKTLHQLNCRGLWLSLYEQTLAELALSRSMHSLIQEPNRTLGEILQGLDMVTQLLVSAKAKAGSFSNQSVAVLRGLFLLIGSHILTKFSSNPSSQSPPAALPSNPTNQFSLLDLSDAPPQHASASPSTGSVASEILARVQKIGNAAEWAVQLLQPTPADIGRDLWLQAACDNESHTQMEYLRLIGQVPWSDIAALSADAAKASILLPLQRLLVTAAKRNFLSLIVNIGKATCVVGCNFPELALSCVAVLMRSPWPSKAIAVPLLTRCFPWNSLSRKDDALLLFAELYQMFQIRPAEYANLKPPQRQDHRDFYIGYVLIPF